MSEHLDLPFYSKTFERKKHGGGRIEPREDRERFSKIQILKLREIKKDFDKDKEKFKQFFDPNLLFKIELKQRVPEEKFREFLERNKIQIISPSPKGTGYWISLAKNDSLDEVEKKLKDYGRNDEKEARYKNIFDAIEKFDVIPPEDKIGEGLKEKPLQEGEECYLDIEIWKMEAEKEKLFLEGFKKLITAKKGEITDEFITDNICLLRAKINKNIFDEIILLKEISRIDKPPKPYITLDTLSYHLEEFEIGDKPPYSATAVAILDSGILSKHPLLEKSVGDEISVPLLDSNKITEDKPQDDVGHGTKVAGITLYGDIKKCIDEKTFQPDIWILSAKIMFKNEYGEAEYNPRELLEHQLEKAVRYFAKNYTNFKIVNLSLGDPDKRMFGSKRQFLLATLIDELANDLNIIFVISAGNLIPNSVNEYDYYLNNYPNCLIEEKDSVKIMNPASSAYAITVGSIAQKFGPSNIDQEKILSSPAQTNYPSPFTCVGPGYKGMIKPELVEEGGNIIYVPKDIKRLEDIGGKLVVLNHKWIEDGKLFTFDSGTSFSAPKVAHYIAKLFNHFPNYSPNLIKALILASADIPSHRPHPLDEINFNHANAKKLMDLLKIYGFGKPNLDRAISSDSNRVLLQAENKIKLDNIHLYYFYMPKQFVETDGEREISVVLTYNPPIAGNRSVDYFGISMEYHLFKNSEIQEVIKGYDRISQNKSEIEENIPEELKLKEVDLYPKGNIRKKGLHQKGVKIYSKKPDIDANKPLVLVVISKNNWLKDKEYIQDYAVVVTVKHKAKIDLYNLVRQQIQQRVRIR